LVNGDHRPLLGNYRFPIDYFIVVYVALHGGMH
jgi:hypothetical protein